MAERLTFSNYDVYINSVYRIGDGVIKDMAIVFDHELTQEPDVDNLGQLITAVGPAKELQENIGRVQEKLGTDAGASDIARDWVERSGLLLPISRSYISSETDAELRNFDVAVISGGVRNWMQRRAKRLLPETNRVGRALLVAGNRQMKEVEGADVREGMTEADYMDGVVRSLLTDAGVEVEMVRVDSGSGNEVMGAAAERIGSVENVLVASNAGAWVQNAGQLRRAVRNVHPRFDENGNQLFVVSDSFPLGTGEAPTATHQNPFSALGQIVRNAQELVRHQD